MSCPVITRIHDPFKINKSNVNRIFEILESAVFCMPYTRMLIETERNADLIVFERGEIGIRVERKTSGAQQP